LRRAIPSFTVEVRRRPRLATTAGESVQSSETKILQTGAKREPLTVAAAAVEADRSNQILIEAVASRPKGRILWSLVPEEPSASLPASTLDPTSYAPKGLQSRAAKGGDQTSKSRRNLKLAPLVDDISTASCGSHDAPQDERTGLSPGEPTAPPSQAAGNGSHLPVRSKAKRPHKKPITVDDSGATPSLEDQRNRTGTDCPPAPPPSVDESSRQTWRRMIMGRYVFGDGLKPGDRWKRRLLKNP
jgi:hypothetical protein